MCDRCDRFVSVSLQGFNLSTTEKPFELDDVDEEEYEYVEDFFTTHGKDLSNYQSMFTDDESSQQSDENDELIISDVRNTSTPSHKLTTITSTAKPMGTTKTTSAGDHNDFSQNIFSPQQFILNQNHAKQSAQSLVKLEVTIDTQSIHTYILKIFSIYHLIIILLLFL